MILNSFCSYLRSEPTWSCNAENILYNWRADSEASPSSMPIVMAYASNTNYAHNFAPVSSVRLFRRGRAEGKGGNESADGWRELMLTRESVLPQKQLRIERPLAQHRARDDHVARSASHAC